MSYPSRSSGRTYWVLVLVLLAIGFLAILSVGFLFLGLGLALIGLSPFRSKPQVFGPGLALVLGFLTGYALFAPWECTAMRGLGRTLESCQSLIGIEYTGSPVAPGLGFGAAFAVVAGVATWAVVNRQAGRDPR